VDATSPVVAVDGGAAGPGVAALIEPVVAGRARLSVVDPEGRPEPGAEILVILPGDRSDLGRALTADIRWVHLLSAGADGFPFELLEGRLLSCSRGAQAPAIAEFVLATMLAFEKDLPAQWRDRPPERWGTARLGTLVGRSLGLVGVGAIGTEIARRALAFDMSVVAVRRRAARSPLNGVTILPTLTELAALSDHLVVAAPATEATTHLVGEEVLAAVRPGVHLVNIARGSLIDQKALHRALDDGRVAMASLDVTEPEPLPPGHWLYDHPRARISAHVSWSSPGTMARTAAIFGQNLTCYLAGLPLDTPVDPGTGY
jgi:phosphoglycerate dehydrogenase-like enzyme